MEPDINTWMASVIWSRSGWRAWTSCPTCAICEVRGGAIPFPRGPASEQVPTVGLSLVEGLVALAFVAGGIAYVCTARRRGT
jgi:hypothetical protein